MTEEKKRTVVEGAPCQDCRAHGTLGLRLEYVESDHEDLRDDFKDSKKVIWDGINKLNDTKVSFTSFKMFMTLIIALLTIGAGLLVETRIAVVKELGEIRKEINGQTIEKDTQSSTLLEEKKEEKEEE